MESKDSNGQTPLWWAAESGHEVVVKLLVEKSADLESKDRSVMASVTRINSPSSTL
jgi:ankyrin repeat protein